MFEIANNGILTIVKGDTASFPLFINVGTSLSPKQYVLSKFDKVQFGIGLPNTSWEDNYFTKTFTYDNLNDNNDVVISLTEDETNSFPLGTSYYRIKLITRDQTTTIVGKTKLNVLEDGLSVSKPDIIRDFAYGELDYKILKVIYDPHSTDTASTHIDESNNGIVVDVIKVPNNLIVENLEDNSFVSFNGSGDVKIQLPKVSDKATINYVDNIKNIQEQKLSDVITQHNTDVEELRSDYSSKINDVTTENNLLKTDVDNLEKEYRSSLISLQAADNKNELAMQNLTTLYREDIEEFSNQLSEKIAREELDPIIEAIGNKVHKQEGKDLFSGSYNDLEDKPFIPSKISDLEDDTTFITEQELDDRKYLTEHQSLDDYALKSQLFSKDYNELTNKPFIPTDNNDLANGKGYITDKALIGYATESWVEAKKYLTAHQDISGKADVNHNHDDKYAAKEHTHSQYLTEHQDLSHKADKVHNHDDLYASKEHNHDELYAEKIHTHSQYLTEHQSLNNYYNKTEVNTALDNKADKEHTHSQYLTAHQSLENYFTKEEVTSALELKADKIHSHDLSTYALKSELFSKDYNDLSNKPTIPSKVSELTNDKNFVTNSEMSKAITDAVGNVDLSELETSISIHTSNTNNPHNVTKSQLGLENVLNVESYSKNESDLLLAEKVSKVTGKGLSTNDFTNDLKTKLEKIEAEANKYVLPTDVVKDSNYVHTDNNYTTADKNKLAGLTNYDDGDIQKALSNKADTADIPTKISELENDKNFITVEDQEEVQATVLDIYTKTEIDDMINNLNVGVKVISNTAYEIEQLGGPQFIVNNYLIAFELTNITTPILVDYEEYRNWAITADNRIALYSYTFIYDSVFNVEELTVINMDGTLYTGDITSLGLDKTIQKLHLIRK